MSENRVKKKRWTRRPRRLVRRILALLLIIVALYLLMLSAALFGGEDLGSNLRKYKVIDEPAEYIEQILNITSPAPTAGAGEIAIVITVSEDIILFEGDEVTLEELEQIVSEQNATYVELVDDGAKRVTYTKVYNELERLGVIIEE